MQNVTILSQELRKHQSMYQISCFYFSLSLPVGAVTKKTGKEVVPQLLFVTYE
jgi:hypothetical protein